MVGCQKDVTPASESARPTTDPTGRIAAGQQPCPVSTITANSKFGASDATMLNADAVGWPSKCLWSLHAKPDDMDYYPHHHVHQNYSLNRMNVIHDSALDLVGQTPIVRVKNFAKLHNIKCDLLVKCEFMNPGGSVKDRIALRMIDDAERDGRLVPNDGYTIIEPTSGNTGIGLAMVAAVRGYRCIIVMPEKMSAEKENVLRALGAEIIRTPTEAKYNDKDSHITKSIELCKQIPKSIVLNQYRASGNPLAHYDGTAEELLLTCSNRVDAVVAGAGTGGTISGLARKIKERLPECKLIGADPVGSILAQPEQLNQLQQGQSGFYEVEGIGYDFIPTVLDRNLIDKWYKTTDECSLRTARELIRHEAILAGGSSGSAMHAALQAIEDLGLKSDPSKRVVVILPDGVRNYMSKFISDDWMRERNL